MQRALKYLSNENMANPKNLFVKMYDPSPQRHKLRIILTHLVACTAGINGGVKEVFTLSLFLCFMPAFEAEVLDAIFYVTRLNPLVPKGSPFEE